MARTTKTLTFSLSTELAERVDRLTNEQGCTRGELLRRAVLRYIEECEWKQLLRYGEQRARATGIGPDDVGVLIGEYRAEEDPGRA
jgi:predicted DNA-binding protein